MQSMRSNALIKALVRRAHSLGECARLGRCGFARGRGRGGRLQLGARGFDSNQAHHAVVFMLEEVAVIEERSDGIWVAKIHAQSDARIRERPAIVKGHVDRIAKKRLVHCHAG